jgi:hypothetical protein
MFVIHGCRQKKDTSVEAKGEKEEKKEPLPGIDLRESEQRKRERYYRMKSYLNKMIISYALYKGMHYHTNLRRHVILLTYLLDEHGKIIRDHNWAKALRNGTHRTILRGDCLKIKARVFRYTKKNKKTGIKLDYGTIIKVITNPDEIKELYSEALNEMSTSERAEFHRELKKSH